MDVPLIATPIRTLFVVTMFGLIVIAGALVGRRQPSNGRQDALPDPSLGPSLVQRSQRHPVSVGSRNSNDADVATPYAERHAA